MRLRDFSLPVSALLLCAGSGLARAATITFSAAAGQPVNNSNLTGCTPLSGSSSGPIAFSVTCGGALGVGTGTGGADFGHAGAMATVAGFSSALVQMAGGASFSDDGFIFTATGPGVPGSVPISLNLALAGIINSTPNADAILDIQVILNGTGVGLLHIAHGGGSVVQCVSTFAGGAGCGIGQFLGTSLTSGQVVVPLNQPVGLQVLIQVAAEAVSGGASSTIDFSHSIDFPIGSDIFNLPAGVTVNEPGMSVFNNRFLASTSTPEPSSLLLIGLGLTALPLFRRYRMAHP